MTLMTLPRSTGSSPAALRIREAERRALERMAPLFTFASIEPMLGPIILDSNAPDWIICGGESGPNARWMNPEWARSLRDQSAQLGRAFFMKQMTKKGPIPADLFVRQFPEALVKSRSPSLVG